MEQAQRNKLELICRKTAIGRKTDHVLDIGCGWGGFAKYAAEHYGCKVTAVNISKEQLRYARGFCKGLPIEFLECDYREILGAFDKIVSVGMFEHVGSKNYRTFMKIVHHSLTDDGVFLLHTIGGNESRRTCDPWVTKYIFPNGMLPTIAQISRAVEGLFAVEDWHNLGPHYDKTLMAWTSTVPEGLAGAAEKIRRALQAHVGVLPALQRRCVSRPQQPGVAGRADQGRFRAAGLQVIEAFLKIADHS